MSATPQAALLVQMPSQTSGLMPASQPPSHANATRPQDLRLQLLPGQALQLVGPPGCGKSSLLACIMGLPPATLQGTPVSIVLHGLAIAHLAPAQRAHLGLGYVAQTRSLWSDLSLLDHLQLGLHAAKLRRKHCLGPLVLTLAEVWQHFPELYSKRHVRAQQLSGGQQQTLAMLRCILSRPSVLLLDEVGEGLAPAWLAIWLNLFQRLKQQGASLLFTASHCAPLSALGDGVFALPPCLRV